MTLTEAIKVFELAIANQSRCSGAAYWLEIERKEYILPGRDGDVLRAFWKEFSKTGLESYIRTATENKRRFSFLKEHIPEIKQIPLNAQLKILDPTMDTPIEPMTKAPVAVKDKIKQLQANICLVREDLREDLMTEESKESLSNQRELLE